MKCPFCSSENTRVIDSRPADDNNSIRRRRLCDECNKRFTTYEKVEETIVMVIKKDGRREAFDRAKILNGIIKACEKRPVTMAQMENIVTVFTLIPGFSRKKILRIYISIITGAFINSKSCVKSWSVRRNGAVWYVVVMIRLLRWQL